MARYADLCIKRCGVGALLLANGSREKTEALLEAVGGRAATNNEIAESADLRFIGVKLQLTAEMLADISPVLASRKDRFMLFSMVAGLNLQRVRAIAVPARSTSLPSGCSMPTSVSDRDLAFFCLARGVLRGRCCHL